MGFPCKIWEFKRFHKNHKSMRRSDIETKQSLPTFSAKSLDIDFLFLHQIEKILEDKYIFLVW